MTADPMRVGQLRRSHADYNTQHAASGINLKRRREALCALIAGGLCNEVIPGAATGLRVPYFAALV